MITDSLDDFYSLCRGNTNGGVNKAVAMAVLDLVEL
jgi:hypothetical protein